MTESKPEVSNSKTFDTETLTKQFAFLAILLYIIGFLTTNLYLQQFGFSDFSPINPRFILTGSLVILSILFNDIFCFVAILLIREQFFKNISNKPPTFRRQAKLVITKLVIPFVLLFPVLLLFSLFSFIIVFGFVVVKYSHWEIQQIKFYSVKFYILGLLVGFIPLLPWLVAPFKEKTININLKINSLSILIICLYIQLCGLYIEQFAKYIYSNFPEQIGGGEPRKIIVQFTKAQADALQKKWNAYL